MSPEECRKYLRYLELDAYAKMVSALRAQGPLTEEKQKLLGELAHALHIPSERHKAEVRRAVNDDKLALIAEQLFGPNSDTEWSVEGRRMIPLFPRLKGRTAYTTFANSLSLTTAIANDRSPSHLRKPEGKYKTNPYCHPKYNDKYSNNDGKNTFVPRKRKRSSHEINSFNNGAISYPSTSYNKKTFKSLNNAKSYLPQTVKSQNTVSRQRIDSVNTSEPSHSQENIELRLAS
ncbi:BRCA2-interacting transcriptional repressor EMSY [Copidosoma floridanum]|uniref:BRCA2-interacting transcriptional repressor EMSY n=1 Tax=Copidosoma floridanum TaxID=29053 RepID=UPI0006C9729A|nr:BRCA2-interacting transcriptional repressor EMSY [Copidosoma floridanum]